MLELYAPLITPFDDDESVDIAGFLENLQWYESRPLDGYLINGSSGEAEMLTPEEQLGILQAARSATKRTLFAGIAPQSLRAALRELERLADLKLDGVLVRTPSYFGSQLDQLTFYRDLAAASSFPVLIYQIPQNTGVRIDEQVLAKLVECPNIVGIKDSLGDLTLLQEVPSPKGFRYLLGAANLMVPGLRAGASGGILALANVIPERCREMLDLANAGHWNQAGELQRRVIPLNRAIGGSRGYGIAGLKAAVELRGLRGGPPRRPLKRLGPEEREALRALVDGAMSGG
jgi:dihydrodipicolinate synthase/N-acetylneuraminate lyase